MIAVSATPISTIPPMSRRIPGCATVLGSAATMSLVKPFLESDGSTLSSGVGVVTQADYSAYTALETQLGIG